MVSSISFLDTNTVDMCPRTRLEIIWMCLATIFAASWVAVHPNMPGPNVSTVKKTLRRMEMMLWTIIVPEVILLWAMAQWHGAKAMEHEFISESRKPKDTFKWTTKYGLLLQMGGFVLIEKGRAKQVLRWETLMEYHDDGRVDLSTITEAAIDDRSKGHWFCKCIALIQTSWFIVQSIARFSDRRLVLTQLELLTAGLAVLSLLMYCFWWNKPFDADLPIAIILLDPIHAIGSHQDPSIQDLSIQTDGNDILPIRTQAVPNFRASSPEGIQFVCSNVVTWDSFLKLTLIPYYIIKYVVGYIDEFLSASQPFDTYSMTVPVFCYYQGVSSSSVGSSSIYPTSTFRYDRPRILLVATLFGAIHCAGWSDKIVFHMRAASLLWRIFSVIIISSPLMWISPSLSKLVHHAAVVKGTSKVLAKVTHVLVDVTLILFLFLFPFTSSPASSS
ncbi:hypothetical protein D9613_008781 [Agrocybe pediades]|uniref:Uncharacterized protein n=1 Tax=Agrocybe pediades TaxID=84607 RepID=A0A8H4QRY2_9AGAR|nr:hypothetical protein D9613_008781 [Agrocybe pediades]